MLWLNNPYHCDVEGVKKVKGQRRNQIHKEPRSAVMDAYGVCVVDHLTGLAHIGGAEVQDNI